MTFLVEYRVLGEGRFSATLDARCWDEARQRCDEMGLTLSGELIDTIPWEDA